MILWHDNSGGSLEEDKSKDYPSIDEGGWSISQIIFFTNYIFKNNLFGIKYPTKRWYAVKNRKIFYFLLVFHSS